MLKKLNIEKKLKKKKTGTENAIFVYSPWKKNPK